MGDPENRCSVCLDIHDKLHKITNTDYQNESLKMKLESVVSEVEWSENYSICQSCLDQLEIAFKFRRVCLMLDYRRKGALIPEVENQVYVCYHCGEQFHDKKLLSEHIQTHLKPSLERKKKFFSCEICDLRLNQAKLIVEHCIRDHAMNRKNVKPFSCDEDKCSMRFISSANLIQHKKYHKGARTHICSFCGKAYITKSDLTVHEYTHQNLRRYKCVSCNKAFNTNKNLYSHNLVVHTDQSLWKYSCEICKRNFPLKSGFDQHMKRHAGDKKFGCLVCDKSFVSRTELLRHVSYHSKEKPFKCDHCDKTYKERRIFGIHLTKSHGIGNAKIPVKAKKFVCEACPSKFSDRQKLERHVWTHLGVKPYQCPQCDKKFSDKYYRKQHLKNIHNVEPETYPP